MTQSAENRTFSEERHQSGAWKTRVDSGRNPLVRLAWNYLSFKRQGCDRLAAACRPGQRGLDLGCGNGAYSHWFMGRRPCCIAAMDWSFTALRSIRPPSNGRILRVCGDARFLPFKQDVFDFLFSIDMAGHIGEAERVIDEMFRVLKPACRFFFHSECSDYLNRWPDKALVVKLGHDMLAQREGHIGLRPSADVYRLLVRRFDILAFFSPAGLAGWLLGYPEKYRIAFAAASWRTLALLTGLFALCKRLPVAGAILRFVNATSNRVELFFRVVGGGSCFAQGAKPAESGTAPQSPR
jgi:SAM-dependent methyltransferase